MSKRKSKIKQQNTKGHQKIRPKVGECMECRMYGLENKKIHNKKENQPNKINKGNLCVHKYYVRKRS